MDERIIVYIKKSLESGHHINKIKQALINAGHGAAVVEEHVAHVLSLKKRDIKYVPAALAFLALLILIIGVYYLYGYYKKPAEAINQTQIEELQRQKGLAYLNNALIRNDSSLCNEISDDSLKEQCQRRFLPDISNETTEGIGNESIAVKKGKELLNKALISHNASICLDIEDNTIKLQCEAILKK